MPFAMHFENLLPGASASGCRARGTVKKFHMKFENLTIFKNRKVFEMLLHFKKKSEGHNKQ
jgi:hypothetical protein